MFSRLLKLGFLIHIILLAYPINWTALWSFVLFSAKQPLLYQSAAVDFHDDLTFQSLFCLTFLKYSINNMFCWIIYDIIN